MKGSRSKSMVKQNNSGEKDDKRYTGITGKSIDGMKFKHSVLKGSEHNNTTKGNRLAHIRYDSYDPNPYKTYGGSEIPAEIQRSSR
jgi:hypothetical protein